VIIDKRATTGCNLHLYFSYDNTRPKRIDFKIGKILTN